jgi:hypothetical protein
MPGQYTVLLTVNGKSYSQPLIIKMDPRVKTPMAGLQQQFRLSNELYTHLLALSPAVEQAGNIRKQLKDLQKQAQGDVLASVKALDQKLEALAGGVTRRPAPGNPPPSLGGLRTRYLALLNVLQEVDAAPTTQATTAASELQQQLPSLMQQWETVKSQDIPALNAKLKGAGLPEIKL